MVLSLHLFQNDVDSLDGEDRAFLTYQDRCVDAERLDMGMTLDDVSL